MLPESDCRYGVFDYHYKDKEGCEKTKIFFVSWCAFWARGPAGPSRRPPAIGQRSARRALLNLSNAPPSRRRACAWEPIFFLKVSTTKRLLTFPPACAPAQGSGCREGEVEDALRVFEG